MAQKVQILHFTLMIMLIHKNQRRANGKVNPIAVNDLPTDVKPQTQSHLTSGGLCPTASNRLKRSVGVGFRVALPNLRHQTRSQGHHRHLHPIVHRKLRHDAPQMRLNRTLTEEQRLGDRPITLPRHQ
jgi:hypothetical protein